MPAINIVVRYMAIQYTGSNSAAIDALISNFDITSESGGTLVAESNGTRTINTNDWVVYTQGAVTGVYTPTEFNSYYIENAVAGDTAGLDARVTAIEAADSGVLAVGVADAPTILGSSSVNVDVNIIPAQLDNGYTPSAELFAASTILGSLSINSVTALTGSVIRVNVQNTGLISLSGIRVLVTATA